MDALTCLFTRRSIRTFTDSPILPKDVETLLKAGMAAPSAGNAQPFRFVVVTEPDLLQKIPTIHPYAAMAANAPLGILVCADVHSEKYPGFWVQDCSAAIQNILIAARALSIGSVWTGIYPDEEREKAFTAMFNLPEGIRPLGLVVLGFTKQPFAERDTFDLKKVHFNTW